MTTPEPTYTEYRGWHKWAEKFKPTPNHILNQDGEHMYETYGEEVEHVIKTDSKYIWTLIQGDMSDLIVAGYHYVNRLGYYITEVPWEDEYDYALISVEIKCECYDEETGEGKDECFECEGSGLVAKYVD
jgi:hypothetical protein